MATVSWSKAVHIEGLGETLCGRNIPLRNKEWNAFGTPTCKSCIKVKAVAAALEEYESREVNGQCPFNSKKTFVVNPINKDSFLVSQFIGGVYQSQTTADRYRTSEIAYISQDILLTIAS
ncbi:MAG: hypothetical protein ACI87J_002252 [Colwellia sp.]|jgi:hypothetical protein